MSLPVHEYHWSKVDAGERYFLSTKALSQEYYRVEVSRQS